MVENARPSDAASDDVAPSGWTFLSNHSHVLVCLVQDPEVRVTEIARRVGIGERAVQRILHDLEEAGYLTRERHGRRNVYTVHLDRPLRHPLEAAHRIVEVFGPLSVRSSGASAPDGGPAED
jgi:DNA-binding transcriptional ArsR family regulator